MNGGHLTATVPLSRRQVEQQPLKLKKSLKDVARNSSQQRVHQVRTRTRRMAAMLHALGIDTKKNERALLKAIDLVRKKAGKVRDMDVLTGFASTLQEGEPACVVRLLEHLGARRAEHAGKLEKFVSDQRSEMKRRLERCHDLLVKILVKHADLGKDKKWAANSAAQALQLASELREWPRLNRENLHPFRLKVKELRYVLQMASHGDEDFVEMLGQVKDAIGEWHDYRELGKIAKEVLRHPGCALLRQIHLTTDKKFEHALGLSKRLINKGLAIPSPSNGSSKGKTTKGARALVSVFKLAS